MTTWTNGWQIVKQLGVGGQGTVDLVVTAARRAERQTAVRKIVESIEFITPHARDQNDAAQVPSVAEDLAAAIENINRPDLPTELGALKQLHVPDGPEEREQAMERFGVELRALRQLHDEPGILRLLNCNEAERWMVTEYHEGGTTAGAPATIRRRCATSTSRVRSHRCRSR